MRDKIVWKKTLIALAPLVVGLWLAFGLTRGFRYSTILIVSVLLVLVLVVAWMEFVNNHFNE